MLGNLGRMVSSFQKGLRLLDDALRVVPEKERSSTGPVADEEYLASLYIPDYLV